MHGGKPDTASINQNFTKAGTYNLGHEGDVMFVPVELSCACCVELANCSYDQALPTSFEAFCVITAHLPYSQLFLRTCSAISMK
jgi:hypothetical protein